MAQSPFYDDDPDVQVAINLFHGWGYNFYRRENQLRADDLMVRAKVGAMLGAARAGVDAAEGAYRREHLQAPSREHPRPDPAALADAGKLEALSQSLGALEGQIRALPAPENDRMTERHRSEADTLVRLIAVDTVMVARAEQLRAELSTADAAWLLANQAAIAGAVAVLQAQLQVRRDMLLG